MDLEAFGGGGKGRYISEVWAQRVSVHAICTASPASGDTPRIYFQELLHPFEEQEDQTALSNLFANTNHTRATARGPI